MKGPADERDETDREPPSKPWDPDGGVDVILLAAIGALAGVAVLTLAIASAAVATALSGV